MSTVRRFLSKKERFAIFTRDNFTCQYCGRAAPDVVLHVDHYIPVAAGGPDDSWNLVTACQDCNLGKRHYPTRRAYLQDWMFHAIGIGFVNKEFSVKMEVSEVKGIGIKEELQSAYSNYGSVPIDFSYRRIGGQYLSPGKVYRFNWSIAHFLDDFDFDPEWPQLKSPLELLGLISERALGIYKKENGTEGSFALSVDSVGQGLLTMLSPGPLSVLCWNDNSEG